MVASPPTISTILDNLLHDQEDSSFLISNDSSSTQPTSLSDSSPTLSELALHNIGQIYEHKTPSQPESTGESSHDQTETRSDIDHNQTTRTSHTSSILSEEKKRDSSFDREASQKSNQMDVETLYSSGMSEPSPRVGKPEGKPATPTHSEFSHQNGIIEQEASMNTETAGQLEVQAKRIGNESTEDFKEANKGQPNEAMPTRQDASHHTLAAVQKAEGADPGLIPGVSSTSSGEEDSEILSQAKTTDPRQVGNNEQHIEHEKLHCTFKPEAFTLVPEVNTSLVDAHAAQVVNKTRLASQTSTQSASDKCELGSSKRVDRSNSARNRRAQANTVATSRTERISLVTDQKNLRSPANTPRHQELKYVNKDEQLEFTEYLILDQPSGHAPKSFTGAVTPRRQAKQVG
ncbi:unnamed protein product [Protopolystoma xenopodis]|uniref:Uncharacterized protein n=1 Tax=Protopolystoma xenopodis TaxID=117903 RepID=A0A448XGP8_9PLAT|nr:unnamed protein product [Protopolystoma xenopodis]